MKYALPVIISFLSFTLWGQKEVLRPNRNDNVIIVSTDTINKNALEKAASALITQGFTIKEKNKVKGTLATNPFPFDNGKLVINVLVALNEIKIYGMFEPNLAIVSGAGNPKQLTRKIYYDDLEGSTVRKAWNIMDAFANQLAQNLNGSVTFLKW